jgi:hypothetical protein
VSFVNKIYQVYKDGGIPAVVKQAKAKYYRDTANLVISWANISILREFVGKKIKTLQPTALVLSLPRSGSSWVGETLGNSTNALYLREPMTISYQVSEDVNTVLEIDPLTPPKIYKKAADLAFSGIPAFPRRIVKKPEQWSIVQRTHRRVIIKEVNPLALSWYLQKYRPRIIFLVRHPAAVALSYWYLGWRGKHVSNRDEFFIDHGHFQGRVLQTAMKSLGSYNDYKIVLYEDICDRPVSIFEYLFDFAGFTWDRQMVEFTIQHTTAGDRSIHWSTYRDSKSMIRAWDGKISQEELNYLRASFWEYDLPWYKSEKEWKI